MCARFFVGSSVFAFYEVSVLYLSLLFVLYGVDLIVCLGELVEVWVMLIDEGVVLNYYCVCS